MKSLLFILILLFPAILNAYTRQDDFPMSISFYLGIISHDSDHRSGINTNGATGSVNIDFHLEDYFAFGMKAGFVYFDNRYIAFDALQIGYFAVSSSLTLNTGKPLRPFLFGGLGIYTENYESHIRYDPDSNVVHYNRHRRHISPGYLLGTGLEVSFRKHVSVAFSLCYHKIIGNSDLEMLSGELGLKYYF